MAKYISEIVTRERKTIVCSSCGTKSNLHGKALERYLEKNWYCRICRPDDYRRVGLHCSNCGHPKTWHVHRRRRKLVYEECIKGCSCSEYQLPKMTGVNDHEVR